MAEGFCNLGMILSLMAYIILVCISLPMNAFNKKRIDNTESMISKVIDLFQKYYLYRNVTTTQCR